MTLRRCYSGGVLQIICSLQYGVEKLLTKDLHLSNSFFLEGKLNNSEEKTRKACTKFGIYHTHVSDMQEDDATRARQVI